MRRFNPLSANPTKWSNTLKQFICKLQTNCLSVFEQIGGFIFTKSHVFLEFKVWVSIDYFEMHIHNYTEVILQVMMTYSVEHVYSMSCMKQVITTLLIYVEGFE